MHFTKTAEDDLPVWLPVEEGTRGVDVDDLSVHNGAVSLLWILLGRVTEKPAADGFLHPGRVLAARHHVQLVSAQVHKI